MAGVTCAVALMTMIFHLATIVSYSHLNENFIKNEKKSCPNGSKRHRKPSLILEAAEYAYSMKVSLQV